VRSQGVEANDLSSLMCPRHVPGPNRERLSTTGLRPQTRGIPCAARDPGL
jgi:hypothetical protein